MSIWIPEAFCIVYDPLYCPLFFKLTDVLEWIATLKHLGAKWLLEKEVTSCPVCHELSQFACIDSSMSLSTGNGTSILLGLCSCCTCLFKHNYKVLLLDFAWFKCNFLVLMLELYIETSIDLNVVKCIFAVLQMVFNRITASVFPVFYPKVFTQ